MTPRPLSFSLAAMILLTGLGVRQDVGEAPIAPSWCEGLPRAAYASLARLPSADDWFEVYVVGDGVYAIYEPHQWQEVISYLVVGSERALLFDTGMGIGSISTVVAGLTDLPVTVLNSHTHPDHVGGNAEFDRILAVDTEFTRRSARGRTNDEVREEVAVAALCRPLPSGVSEESYRVRPFAVTETVDDGHEIDLGGRRLEVLRIPGHTPDSLALVDRDAGYVWTGDSFYEGPIWLFWPGTDLDAYGRSVTRLADLVPELSRVFTAHNTPVAEPARLTELRDGFAAVRAGTAVREPAGDGLVRYDRGAFSFLMAAPAQASEPGPGSAVLDGLIQEYRELGRGPLREALTTGDPEAPLDPYRQLLERVREVDPAPLDTAEAVDRAYLIGVLETDIRSTEARIARPEGEWAIGKELYDFIIQRRWFLDADADDIIARGRQAFEAIEAEAQEVAGRIRPGADWVEVYESLKDAHPQADGIKDAYQAQMDAAREFVLAHDIVTLPAGERVVTVDTPEEQRRMSPYGTFDSVDPFGDGLEGRLVLTPIEDWMSAEQRAERLRAHHDTWIPIIAVHEAYPGHHVQALKVRENPRPLRRLAGESIYSEGWGLYTEQLMWDLGFLQGDEVYLTILRNRLWRAARVILDASLHTGRMTVSEAEAFLVDRVRFDPYAAELEVAMYPRRPTYVLGYLIGMEEIARIHHDWVAIHGEPDPPSRLWDAFLSTGSLPPALVRAELLDEPVPTR